MYLRFIKGKRKNIPSYGKLIAKSFHPQTIDKKQLFDELQKEANAKQPVVEQVLSGLAKLLKYHLQNGDIVEIPHIGTMKMDVESRTFDSADDFEPSRHIKRHKISFIPESYKGKQALLEGIQYTILPIKDE
ncbi:MAG: HU family DNA-binding protein [Prevotella sp.]|nr:HU family DNA-binding protein [Prevotella sp.]